MANLTGLVNHDASPESQFAALPSGEYPALITDSAVKQTKSGNGSYLELTYQVIDGPYKGRQLWARINLTNPNATAVTIGQQHLAQVRHATGVLQLNDSQQLHNIPHVIRVEYKPARDQYSESNEVKEYKAMAGGAAQAPRPTLNAGPATAPAAANQGGGLPWQRNAA